jgi:hypothetical protein
MRFFLSAAFLLTTAAFPAVAAPAGSASQAATTAVAPFVKAEAEEVVSKLADTLERDYLVPSAGRAYAAALRIKLKGGGYADFPTAAAFAKAVTADLQAVHRDSHLTLFAPRLKGGKRQSSTAYPADSTILAKGWLAPGVAYVSFSAFFANAATLAELEPFLQSIRGARTLVLDVREHAGGEFDEMDMIFAQLFGTRTALLDMDTRETVWVRDNADRKLPPSIELVPGEPGIVRERHWAVPAADAGLANAKLFVLTSPKTASAAEHLTLALKRVKRATIVGEKTRGAGNYGSIPALGFGYTAFIPDGRTYDPDTGLGWEGTGVAPDVAVPAADALARALALAGVKVDAATALAKLGPVRTSAR